MRDDDEAPRLRLEVEVGAFLHARGIGLAETAIVGLSGGPDSTALLECLVALGLGSLRAVHVDHGIRPEAERLRELELVRTLCRRLRVPLTIARIRPGAVARLARDGGEGLEAAARAYRHAILRRCMRERSATRLYLGHTRDDALETSLMRFLGGAGAGGLGGLPALSGPIARPLIDVGKTEILAYLAEKGVASSTDSTNEDESILRNRLRRRLIPLLDGSFPGWRRGIELAADKARLDEEFLAAAAEGIAFTEAAGGGLGVDAELFASAPLALRLRALQRAASRLGPPPSGPRASLTRAISRSVSSRRVSSRWALDSLSRIEAGAPRVRAAGLELSRADRLLVLRHALDFPVSRGYFGRIDGVIPASLRMRMASILLHVHWSEVGSDSWVPAGSIAFPLVVRSRRPGDALPLALGSKALDELFGEWGLDAASRDLVPVLEDRRGIVAVLGKAFGGRDRFRPLKGTPHGASGPWLRIMVKGA